MPPPAQASQLGGRLSGEDMCGYMESFADRFLKGKVQFETEVLGITRNAQGTWEVSVERKQSGAREVLQFARVVLCTGVSR